LALGAIAQGYAVDKAKEKLWCGKTMYVAGSFINAQEIFQHLGVQGTGGEVA